MLAAVEVEAMHPTITFGKPQLHIKWRGDQACSAKVFSTLMVDQALFTPQTLSGSGDSTQEPIIDPVDYRLMKRGSHNGREAASEGQPTDQWTPKVQDWQEVDEDYEPSGSERKAVNEGVKRRTGRPLSYIGDPNSSHLSEAAKRKIRRRDSNRESARRIRDRRIQETNALQGQVEQIKQQNTLLILQAEKSEADRAKLAADLQQLDAHVSQCATKNRQLHEEASLLRQAVEAKMPLLEHACGKEADNRQQLTSIKQDHSAQAAMAVTPFDSGNQAAKGLDLDTSMYLLPSMDFEKLTTSYFEDAHPSAAITPVPSLDLSKLSSTLLTSDF